MDETKLIFGLSKDAEEDKVKKCKDDLDKIVKYLIRQTYAERNISDSENWKNFQKLSFWEFLYEAGMFDTDKNLHNSREEDRLQAKQRYYNALSAGVKGTAMIILKRKVKHIFINGYNSKIMKLQKSNHDTQICIDQFSCAQYICGYLTKNES